MLRRSAPIKTIKTAALAERWSVSDETVRRLCRKYNVRGVQIGGAPNSPIQWNAYDVERVERVIFRGIE